MSYPGVEPGDVQTMNPVGTQENSPGEPQKPYDLTPAADEHLARGVIESKAGPGGAGGNGGTWGAPTPNPLLKEQVNQAVSDMFAVSDAWKPHDAVKFKHEFGSGQTSLLKHLGTMDLVEHGLIEELDFFTRKLFPRSIDASGNPVEHTEENETLLQALRDPEKRRRFMDLTGKLFAAASVRPKVIHDGVAVIDDKLVYGYQMTAEQYLEHFKVPIPPLGENETYSGPISFEDRMELFQELNKPLKMIEPFRDEQATMLQDMAGSQGHGSETE